MFFVLNGSALVLQGVDEPGKGNDALRFLTSTDLKNWTYNSTSNPDTRWYRRSGRWVRAHERWRWELAAACGRAPAKARVE